jgi:molybdopterin-guanine dinucleotide biosynthesis protein B
MFKIISITGYSDSGKTLLIKKIIKRLSAEGYKVGAVKVSSSDIDLNSEGKDTYEFGKSGAIKSIFTNKKSVAIFINEKTNFRDVTPMFTDMDYVLVEGYLNEPVIKLCLDERHINDPLAIDIRKKDIEEIYGIVKEKATILLPNRDNCGYCGEKTCFDMMKKIMNGKRKSEDCVILKEREISIEVDGEKVGLPPFLKKMIKDVNVGMLKNLKLPKNFKEITIKIDGNSIRS